MVFLGNRFSGHEYLNPKNRKYRVGKNKVWVDDKCSTCGTKSTNWMTRNQYEQMKAIKAL